jgi:hypothetical protein
MSLPHIQIRIDSMERGQRVEEVLFDNVCVLLGM